MLVAVCLVNETKLDFSFLLYLNWKNPVMLRDEMMTNVSTQTQLPPLQRPVNSSRATLPSSSFSSSSLSPRLVIIFKKKKYSGVQIIKQVVKIKKKFGPAKELNQLLPNQQTFDPERPLMSLQKQNKKKNCCRCQAPVVLEAHPRV